MKIALVGALPHELRPLLKHVNLRESVSMRVFSILRTTHLAHEVLVAITGIGIRNAEEACKHVLGMFDPDLILSIGFAGALYDGSRIGELVTATSVSLVSGNLIKKRLPIPGESRLLSRLADAADVRFGSFFTLEAPMEKKAVKLLLPAGAAYPVCEMETFPIAEIAREREIAFLAVRSITDTADEEIPLDFFKVAGESAGYRSIKAAGLLLRKPLLAPIAAKLAARSRKASLNLWLIFDALARAL